MDTMTSEPELLSLVLTLQLAAPAPEDRALPKWWGRAAHAFILQHIAAQNPALAAALHDESAPKPFTVSTLMGKKPLSTQQTYALRLTALNAELTALLLRLIEPGGALAPGARCELDFLTFTILTAATQPGQHPWAAQSSYAVLWQQRLLGQTPQRILTFQLSSPLVFHSQGRFNPLPQPDLFFGSLFERWNGFAPVSLPAEFRRYAAECLAVGKFRLTSRAVPLSEQIMRFGAIGDFACVTLNYDRYWMSLACALADFALFSGAGAGTTMGLGQCRRIT